MIKKTIKKFLPKMFIDYLRKMKYRINLKKAYNLDRKRFLSSAFGFNNYKTNIESKIMMNVHSIEKGLTNVNFRLGFGKKAIKKLLNAMNELEKSYDVSNNLIFEVGLSILVNYVEKHKNSKFDTRYIREYIKKHETITKKLILTGVKLLEGEKTIKETSGNFYVFSNSRKSIRNFSEKKIDIKTLYEAINLAKNSPSSCNREPWNIHIINNNNLIKEIMNIHHGLTGFGQNLSTLLLITSDNRYFSGYEERNQGFVDSGIFSMNLIYSLHFYKIATCALNAEMTMKKDMEIREILKLKVWENLIMFIAVGNYPENYKVTISPKKDLSKYIVEHN